jgi:hypothetical protein
VNITSAFNDGQATGGEMVNGEWIKAVFVYSPLTIYYLPLFSHLAAGMMRSEAKTFYLRAVAARVNLRLEKFSRTSLK